MEFDKPIFSGTLSILPIGWKQVLKKTWQQKYCALYKASKFGIERLEIFDNQDSSDMLIKAVPRIITLENCIKIEQKTSTVFSVITKSTMHDFMTNEDTIHEWITMLQMVAFKDFREHTQSNICEDNELYCPSGEGVFSVRLHSTDASMRCHLEPRTYTLVLTTNALELKNASNDKVLFTWPYCFVRRYGHKDGKFTFEAGRKCDSGEGMFLFEHTNQQEIFRCVSSKMKHMKKLLKDSLSTNLKNNSQSTSLLAISTASTPTAELECGENQLHAAMTMEAGSRSPLPPSPTATTTLHDVDHMSNSARREDCNTPAMELERTVKEIPKKPPRKILNSSNSNTGSSRTSGDTDHDYRNYETIQNYDEVERRENAWQTLGTVDVRHSEVKAISEDDNQHAEEYMSWSRKQPVQIEKQSIVARAAKIFSNNISSDENADNSYDRLSFFGSSNKLNSTPSNGYKQVVPAQVLSSIVNASHKSASCNDYDEVGGSLQGIRLADDSHLGYAVVRKPLPKEPQLPEHKLYNDNAYAIISKPKHV